jgi:predicted Zn-dependent peptidase
MIQVNRWSAGVVAFAGVLLVAGCATFSSSKVQIPQPKDYTLKNGLKVLVIEDRTLPYLSVGLMVRAGSSSDPLGKTGLANITSDLLDRGSKGHSAPQIADLFASYGTAFSNAANYDFTYFSTSSLAKDQMSVMKLFFELIKEPAFEKGEIDRAISEAKAEIKRGYDQPALVASRVFSQYLYGAHPYGRAAMGTVRDLESLKPQDIKDFYTRFYRPNNASLVLVGDVQSDFLAKLEELTAGWAAQNGSSVNYPNLPKLASGQVLLVDRPDLKQSEVRMGHFGIKRNNEDYQTLIVSDVILSDGFTSRLMSEIRVKRGLTYGIHATFDARKDFGPFYVASNTRHEKVGELVRETLNVIKEFVAKGVTEQEVEDAKGYLRGSFPSKIETADQLAGLIMGLRFYGLDESYLKNYLKKLDSITAKDVNAVIKKYYHPDQLKVLVYGPQDKVIEQLRPIGAVEVRGYRELL